MVQQCRLLLKNLLLSCVLLLCATSLCAQPSTLQTGGGLGFLFTFHSADIGQISGIPLRNATASNYQSGTGTGFSLQGFADLPVFSSIRTGLRLTYQRTNGTLHATEQTFIAGQNGQIQSAIITHTLASSLSLLGINPYLRFPFSDAFSLQTGLLVALPLVSTYTQSEEFTDPPGILFADGKDKKDNGSGTLSIGIQAAVTAGLSYAVPLNREKTWTLVPEAQLQYGLTTLSGVDWKMYSLGGMLSIMHASYRKKAVLTDTIYHRDTTLQLVAGIEKEQITQTSHSVSFAEHEEQELITRTITITESYQHSIPKPKPLLTATMAIRFVLPGNREDAAVKMQIEHTFLHRATYLPSCILLTKDPLQMLHSYHLLQENEARQFTLSSLSSATYADIIANLLNIIGKRMEKQPGTTLTLTAYDRRLGQAQSAAEKVRSYLTDIWNIEPGRITIRTKERSHDALFDSLALSFLPVEITADTNLLAPIYGQDTVQTASSPLVRFRPQVISEAGVERWNLVLLQDTLQLRQFQGEGDPPATLEWNINDDRMSTRLSDAPIQCRLSMHDHEGQEFAIQGEIAFSHARHESAVTPDRIREEIILPIQLFSDMKMLTTLLKPEKNGEKYSSTTIAIQNSERVLPTLKPRIATIAKIFGIMESSITTQQNDNPSEPPPYTTVTLTLDTAIR